MGYLKIPNLRNVPDLLSLLGDVYALEKIHGTSAHIAWRNGRVHYFSGGVKHALFADLFQTDDLETWFEAMGHGDTPIVVHGEAYGGKCQKMSQTYGPDLRFVAFDVKIGDYWLDVPDAEDVAVNRLGLDFVDYAKGPSTVEWLTEQRNLPSRQGQKILGVDKTSEGIVIRPLTELYRKDGTRIIAKFRNDKFEERKSPSKEIDPAKAEVIADAKRAAEEFVVPVRLEHVLDKIRAERDGQRVEISDTGLVVKRMIEDVKVEEKVNIAWSREVEKEIGRMAAKLFKRLLSQEPIGSTGD